VVVVLCFNREEVFEVRGKGSELLGEEEIARSIFPTMSKNF
jgi:hypothetical protein